MMTFFRSMMRLSRPLKAVGGMMGVLCLGTAVVGAAETPTIWPTLHNDYQRSGYSEQAVRGPYERKWHRDFHHEMIATRVEAIVAEGKCFIGTFAGRLYALDVTDGRTLWCCRAGGPIGASPCYHEGRLYFGADEGFDTGHLYCLDAGDGTLIWKYNAGAGIWVAPACDGETIYFGDRTGVFHALDARTGAPRWTFRTGGMILKPASFSPDRRRIVFGSEDMHVYCLSPDGACLWKSRKLAGLSQRDQGPTIWRGLAIVRTNPADSFHTVLGRNGELLEEIQRSIPMNEEDEVLLDKWGDLIMRPTPRRRRAEQDGIVAYLKEHPHDQCFYAFDLRDGTEPWVAPVLYTAGLHNPPTPPAFHPHTGELYTLCRSALTYYLRGVRRYNALGRIDRATGRFDFYWPASDDGRSWYAFPMIGDETQALSLMDGLLVGNHQGVLGGLGLETARVLTIWPGRDTYGGIFGPGAVEGGFDRARKLAGEGYLTGMPNEWHGPDRSICAVAYGRLFWVVGSQVVCIGGPDIPRGLGAGTEPPALKKSELPWCVAGGNVASKGAGQFDQTVEKIVLTPETLGPVVADVPQHASPQAATNRLRRITALLEQEILEVVEGGPWAPLIVELGISGEERHFWRTAETMQIVALALPYLGAEVRARAVAFLDELWDDGAPLRRAVHNNTGKRREPFTLGPGMNEFAQREVKYRPNVEDLYAVWAYAHLADRWDRAVRDVDRMREIFGDFAKGREGFDHDGTDDEAEHLNAQIAGVLAAARIFQHAGEENDAEPAVVLLAELATERIHHERADKRLIRPTRVASKGLHQAKVPRYVGLVPEVAALLREYAGRSLRRNVEALRRGLPLWYQAYGERMIGGENYISPPHLSRGLFAAWADGCQASAADLAAKLDQPWGKADLYYIEKLAAILRICNVEGSTAGESLGCDEVVSDRVHAFYYPWYSNPETDGAYAHWKMSQFVKQGQAKHYPGGEDIAANFYPALGCYSSNSKADIAAHMRMLRRAGVGVICTSWWGIDDYTDRVVAKLLDGAAAHNIKVCFHIEPFPGRNAATTREAIVYLIDKYGSHPAFYRYGPGRGRPLFYVYDSYLTPAEQWQAVLADDGEKSIRHTRYDAIVIGLWVKQHEEAFMLEGGFDGFYTYFATEGFTYGSTPANWPRLAAWAKRHSKLFIPCVGPGYDDTRIRPWNGENKRSRENGAYYDREFEAALAVGPDVIGVTSFNEWHEGTQIEPAVPKQISGYRYEDYLPRAPEYYLDRTNVWVEKYMSSRVQ